MAGLRPDGRTGPVTAQVHGGLLKDKQFIQGFIADSYIDIQAARLMTIHAAEKIDQGDSRPGPTSRPSRSSCPPPTTGWSTGPSRCGAAAGVSNDLPLAAMYLGARTLRLADGPDEVHKILIAKNVVHRYETGESWDFGN